MASTSESNGSTTADFRPSRFQKAVCLYDWWLILAKKDFQGKRIAISGFTSISREYAQKMKLSSPRQAQRVFTSAPIIKRHDTFTLDTADGICVVINGFINKARTIENGFSFEIFDHFVFGFPPQWEECAVNHSGQESVECGTLLPEGQESVDCGTPFPEGNNTCNTSLFASLEQESLSNVAPLPEAVAGRISSDSMSAPSSLNKETPSNHYKAISEERHDTQILKECSKHVLEVTIEEEIMKEGSEQNCDANQGQICDDVMNQDGSNKRNSNKLLRPPTVCGIAKSTPGLKRKRNTKEATLNSNIKRKINFDPCGRALTREAKKYMSEVSPGALNFKRSRSGRLLIPPLEYWRNEVPVYDWGGAITGILQDSLLTPSKGSRSEPPKKRR